MLMSEWEPILKMSAALTGAIGGWLGIIKPLASWIKRRERDKREAIAEAVRKEAEFKQLVLEELKGIKNIQIDLSDSVALVQLYSMESSYCQYVQEKRYCPSGLKVALNNMYQSYSGKGYNHLSQDRFEAIMECPEHPA